MTRSVPRHSLMFNACSCTAALILALLVLASPAQASTAPVLMGTTDAFGLLAGSTVTNTGPSVITGDLGLHPGTAVTGFPPGTVTGAMHVTDAVALQAKADLVTAYQDAAGRPQTATLPPDLGGRTLVDGVYRTGSVASLGLTGNVTLDGQGNANAVFIFQIASTLVTATDSSVTLINGAQSCNVFWQVGSSATLGTRTALKGNVMALTAISLNDGVVVDGRVLARNAAVTLINDTVTRATCLAGTGAGAAGVPASPGADTTGPTVLLTGVPTGTPATPTTPAATCITRNFSARVRVSDTAGIRLVSVYLDGRLLKQVATPRFSVAINVRGLRVGRHRIKVVASDRAGNRRVTTRTFRKCTLGLTMPQFTG